MPPVIKLSQFKFKYSFKGAVKSFFLGQTNAILKIPIKKGRKLYEK